VDITGAFDNLSHAALLHARGHCPGCALIRQWLKAGYLEQGLFPETSTGVPQGGVGSPVLLNVALQGMEVALGVTHDKRGWLKGARAVGGRHAGTGVKQKGCKSLALNCPCGGLAGGRVYGVIHRLK